MFDGMTFPAKAGRDTRPLAPTVDWNGLKMLRTRPFSTDWLKSPARSSSVGTVRTIEFGRLSSHCSKLVKLKILPRLIGPPMVPPYIRSSVPRKAVVSWPGVRRMVGSAIEFMLGSRP